MEDLYVENPEDVRPKAVRAKAEERLGLDAGFFAETGTWKKRSTEILQAKFEQLMKITENEKVNSKKRKSSEPGDDDDGGLSSPPPKKAAKTKKAGAEKAKTKPQKKVFVAFNRLYGAPYDSTTRLADRWSARYSPNRMAI